MKAIVMDRYGTPDVLELRDVAKPTPKSGEVLVCVHAASVNDWDLGLLTGTPFVNHTISGLFRPSSLSDFGRTWNLVFVRNDIFS